MREADGVDDDGGAPSAAAVRPDDVAALLADAGIGVLVVDAAGTVVSADPLACEPLGHPAGLVGRDLADLVVDRPVLADIFARLAAGRPARDRTLAVRGHDGASRRVLVTASPRRREGGRPAGSCWMLRAVGEVDEAVEQYRMLTEQAPIGIVRARRDGTILAANPSACAIYGHPAGELVGRDMFAFVHPDDRGFDVEKHDQLYTREIDAYTIHKRLLRGDGGCSWVKQTANIVRGPGGAALYSLCFLEDVNALHRADEERRKSEREFRLLARMSPVGMFRADADGGCVYVNEEWSRITGRTLPEALGDGWIRALHPDDREAFVTAWRAAVAAEQPLRGELRILRPDGSAASVLIQTAEAVDAAGRRVFVGTLTDITERVQAEFDRARLAAIVESTVDGLILVDTAGLVLTWNAGAEQVFGFTADEMIGQPIVRLAPGREDELVSLLRRVRAGEVVRDLEGVRRRRSGAPIFTAITACPVRAADGSTSAISLIVRDMTRRRRAEQQREALLADLQRAMHYYDMFIGVLSHDLRSPLAAIIMSTNLALRRSEDERQSVVLRRIATSGARMLRMIEQLLDATRIRAAGGLAIQRGEADLAAICRAIVGELEAANPAARIAFTARGSTVGQWDTDRVAQVASNLIGNAIQHAAGAPTVEVLVDGEDPDVVRLSVHNAGHIPPELLDAIFDPFRRASEAAARTTGLGLGLFITRQIALAHGGDVGVESTPEAGTTFLVELPRGPTPARTSNGEAGQSLVKGDEG